jgi:hypothetical protein
MLLDDICQAAAKHSSDHQFERFDRGRDVSATVGAPTPTV